MKKLSIYLGIIIALFAILYYVDYASEKQVNAKLTDAAQRLYNTDPDKLSKATRDQLNDDNYQRIILPNALDKKLANKESAIVYMFSPVCSFCNETTPILEDLAEDEQVDYVQLNVYEFDEWAKYRLESTPTLIYFEDGVEAARIAGGIVDSESRELYRNFLAEHGK